MLTIIVTQHQRFLYSSVIHTTNIKVSINNAIPESGAEVSVGGLVVLNALGVYENQISDPTFYLVMVDKSYPHFFQ